MKKTTKKAATKAVKKTGAAKPAPKTAKTVKKSVKAAKPAKKTTAKTNSKAVAKPAAKPIAKKAVTAKPVKESHPHSSDKSLQKNEIEMYRLKLQMIRARLSGDVSMMTDAALNKNRMEASGDLSAMPIHMADVGSDNFEQEQTLAFMQSETGLLELVEDALQRIDEGTYGICEGCENRIPKVRLNVLPFASMCVKCAAKSQDEDTW